MLQKKHTVVVAHFKSTINNHPLPLHHGAILAKYGYSFGPTSVFNGPETPQGRDNAFIALIGPKMGPR